MRENVRPDPIGAARAQLQLRGRRSGRFGGFGFLALHSLISLPDTQKPSSTDTRLRKVLIEFCQRDQAVGMTLPRLDIFESECFKTQVLSTFCTGVLTITRRLRCWD